MQLSSPQQALSMSPPTVASRANAGRTVAFLLLAGAVISANAAFVSIYSAQYGHGAPEWPVAIDLLLVLPLLYLALNWRRGRAAAWRVLAIAGFGILVGSFIIPPESKQLWRLLEPLRYVALGALMLAQLCVVGWVAGKIISTRHTENLELVLDRELATWAGRDGIGYLIRTEARVWLYALMRNPIRHAFPGERQFHVYTQGMNASNQQAFLILIGAEIPIAHFLIALFDPVVAAVISALSLYGFAFMLAEYRATIHRPISVDSKGLHVRYGIVTDCFVPWEALLRADRFEGEVRRARGAMRLTGMGQANVELALAPDTRLATLIGPREVRFVYIGIDEPAAFLSEVRSRMRQPALGAASADLQAAGGQG